MSGKKAHLDILPDKVADGGEETRAALVDLRVRRLSA